MIISNQNNTYICSFDENELQELSNMNKIFKQYGKIELTIIRQAISTSFAIKIIPLFYKVYVKILTNIRFDINDEYKQNLLENYRLYQEYGLMIKKLLRQRPNNLPKYLEDEVNKYEEVFPKVISQNPMYMEKVLAYKSLKDIYCCNMLACSDRPYGTKEYLETNLPT